MQHWSCEPHRMLTPRGGMNLHVRLHSEIAELNSHAPHNVLNARFCTYIRKRKSVSKSVQFEILRVITKSIIAEPCHWFTLILISIETASTINVPFAFKAVE